jgi:type 1 glutamine amidotransferase
MPQPLVANLVCGSPWRNHDFDFARLRLGQAIYDLDGIRVDCHQDYEDSGGIANGDLLVSYTSQVPVTDRASTNLRRWLEKGGRWFALHASNSVAGNVPMSRILGSRFITHPKYATFRVQVTAPQDPLLDGIGDFDVPDELYCIENVTNDYEVLLHTRWGGEGFGGISFEEQDHPMLYKRKVGDQGGGILYLALGHANRPFDKPFPHLPDQPDYRGPWDMDLFKTLVNRGIEWAAHRRPF